MANPMSVICGLPPTATHTASPISYRFGNCHGEMIKLGLTTKFPGLADQRE